MTGLVVLAVGKRRREPPRKLGKIIFYVLLPLNIRIFYQPGKKRINGKFCRDLYFLTQEIFQEDMGNKRVGVIGGIKTAEENLSEATTRLISMLKCGAGSST